MSIGINPMHHVIRTALILCCGEIFRTAPVVLAPQPNPDDDSLAPEPQGTVPAPRM
jgi:hypothetical protein